MSLLLFARAACVAISLAAVAPQPSLGQARPAPSPASPAGEQSELQAAIAKSNAYTALMNRTLRAIQSWERYGSWVDMAKGPTGKEMYISYGLYSLYDVTGEIAAATAATAQAPLVADLDQTVKRYIAAYQALAPLITRAERYYERMDYRDDNLKDGRELHGLMVPAAKTFLAERATLDAQMRSFKTDLDARDLVAIETREGRSARWQVRNIMIRARAVVDVMPTNQKPLVDLNAFDAAIAAYSAAMKEMDRFKESAPSTTLMIDSHASSWLGSLREFRDKLGRARGDARKAGPTTVNSLISSYNTMVSLADTQMKISR